MKTSLLLETIKVEEGKVSHPYYHNKRFNESRERLFGMDEEIDLEEHIKPPDDKLYRCRILYDRDIRKIEFFPYKAKQIRTLAFAESQIDYAFKYADRTELGALLAKYPRSDEVLIVKEGYLTDTTIANIAFLQKGRWFTPDKPLLKGTTRERFIDSGFLTAKAIQKEEIYSFDSFALMNAMIGFKIVNPIWLGI